ncbi:MAG: Nif3-like dinuclear metal center hexameric protein [Natrialbaceae archaeon]|nr:Nif3-like dinuclear metal center hexameric protein [Natrialbaceae archaeon]
MELADLVSRFDEALRTADYADLDASPNGLQVGPETGTVEHVAVAVDAAREPIDRAVEADADLLVTHHGLIWGGLERVTDRAYHRLAPLLTNELPLYVSHLPLDGHQELAECSRVADVLGLEDRAPFGRLGDQWIGQRGRYAESVEAETIREQLEGLDTGGQPVQHLPFGPTEVETVAIVTGSGADWLDEARDAGVDAFVTGEGKGKVYHEAREAGIHVFLAGHYATETFGVRALAERCEGWGLETTTIDVPTGL